MTVVWSRVKSSAVSVSSFPGLARRDAAPISPSESPLVNEKSADHRDVASRNPKPRAALLASMILFSANIQFLLFRVFELRFVRAANDLVKGHHISWRLTVIP